MALTGRLATLKLVEIEDRLTNITTASNPDPSNESPAAFMTTPNDPPWNALEAIGVWIASVLFIVIVPTIFLFPYLASLDPPVTGSEQMIEFAKSDPTSIILQIVAIIPAHIFTLILAWMVVTRVRKYPFRATLGWGRGGFAWWHYIAILGIFLTIATVVGSYFPEEENDLIRILRSSRTALYVVAFVATFTAPIVEEVVYRGILYSAFMRKFGVTIAFIVVTFLFALVHIPQYYPSFSTILLLTLLSVILTAVRVKTNNLLPCIILHTLFNGLQSILLIAEPYFKSPEVLDPAIGLFNLIK